MLGEPRAEDALVADRSVRQDQHDAGVAKREVGEPLGERRQAATGVDQDRHLRLFGQREDLVEVAAVEDEVLRARVQLDALRPAREGALGLGTRAFGGVQAAERDEPAIAFAGPLQHAIVGEAVGGLALRVVEREHACASRFGGIELGEQLLERQRATVLVEAEVRVRVDHFRLGGAQARRLGEEGRERLGVDRIVHARHLR